MHYNNSIFFSTATGLYLLDVPSVFNVLVRVTMVSNTLSMGPEETKGISIYVQAFHPVIMRLAISVSVLVRVIYP